MKLMRLAVVAAFALVGGIAIAEDLDVQALQARLAAQEARLNDLQAKVGGSTSAYGFAADMSCGPDAPEAILSLNKNATVKIGGEIGTRYYYHSADVKTSLFRWQDDPIDPDFVTRNTYDPAAPQWGLGDRATVYKMRTGDFKTSDAFVSFTMDVNDNFDAFLRLNLLDAPQGGWGNIADRAWVRWKNICNSGFGVLVGKDHLVFGEEYSMGAITPWTGGYNGEIAGTGSDDFLVTSLGPYIGYDHGRTVQLTPYWKSQDGRYSIEASFFQGIDWSNGSSRYLTSGGGPAAWNSNDSYYLYQKSQNYGWGSASLRLRAEPIEGLKLSASVINAYAKDDGVIVTSPNGAFANYFEELDYAAYWPGYGGAENDSNTAIDLAFKWNPCFLPKFGIWGQWVHNWNAGWQDATADAINAGIWYDFTDRFTAFFQGDYYYRKNNWADGIYNANYKTYAWATYVGLQYKLPYGVTSELGWRHDNIDYKNSFGDKHTVVRGDTIYGSLYFDF